MSNSEKFCISLEIHFSNRLFLSNSILIGLATMDELMFVFNDESLITSLEDPRIALGTTLLFAKDTERIDASPLDFDTMIVLKSAMDKFLDKVSILKIAFRDKSPIPSKLSDTGSIHLN